LAKLGWLPIFYCMLLKTCAQEKIFTLLEPGPSKLERAEETQSNILQLRLLKLPQQRHNRLAKQ